MGQLAIYLGSRFGPAGVAHHSSPGHPKTRVKGGSRLHTRFFYPSLPKISTPKEQVFVRFYLGNTFLTTLNNCGHPFEQVAMEPSKKNKENHGAMVYMESGQKICQL